MAMGQISMDDDSEFCTDRQAGLIGLGTDSSSKVIATFILKIDELLL